MSDREEDKFRSIVGAEFSEHGPASTESLAILDVLALDVAAMGRFVDLERTFEHCNSYGTLTMSESMHAAGSVDTTLMLEVPVHGDEETVLSVMYNKFKRVTNVCIRQDLAGQGIELIDILQDDPALNGQEKFVLSSLRRAFTEDNLPKFLRGIHAPAPSGGFGIIHASAIISNRARLGATETEATQHYLKEEYGKPALQVMAVTQNIHDPLRKALELTVSIKDPDCGIKYLYSHDSSDQSLLLSSTDAEKVVPAPSSENNGLTVHNVGFITEVLMDHLLDKQYPQKP